MDNTDKAKMIIEATKKFKELQNLSVMEDMLENNIQEFQFNNKLYRVKKPGRGQKIEIREALNRKQNELLRNPDTATEEELIQLYLKQTPPKDIKSMRKKIERLQKNVETLAEQITEQEIESEKKKLLQSQDDIIYEQHSIQSEINFLLSSSMEKQLHDYLTDYIIIVCLEVQIEENKWERYFKTYEEFYNANDEQDNLIYMSNYYMAMILFQNDRI